MDTIVSNSQYEEMFRNQTKKQYMIVFYIMIGVSILDIIIGLIVSIVNGEDFIELGVYFLISVAFLLIIGYIFYLLAKRADRPNFEHYAIEKYKNYNANQFKHPLYRIVQYGRSQDIIQQILEIDGEIIKITDIKKKKENLYVNTYKNVTQFKFFVKTRNGIETFKEKILLISNGKKVVIYGSKEYNERLYKYLRAQGFETIIQ